MADARDPRPRRRLDRRTIAICVCIALLAALAAGLITSFVVGDDDASPAAGGRLTLSGDKAVDIDKMLTAPLRTPDGKATTLDRLRDDRPMLVNLWASTCTPCIREMPMLDAASKVNPEIQVIGLATQDPAAKAAKLAHQAGITYPWALDPDGEFFYQVKAAGLPTTLLISPSGAIVDTKTGAFDDEQELQDFIDGAIAPSTGAPASTTTSTSTSTSTTSGG
jgi:thiol-disulfide isomerase/thioredoxin